jgi:hypothetical protein
MTHLDPNFVRRSQTLTPRVPDLVTVDRQTLRRVLNMLGRCADDVRAANNCDIMLYSLDTYLSEQKNPNANKSILLLRYWLDVAPKLLNQAADNLQELHELLKVVLDATE